ncbi:NETI motif-containing protein [Peribacillus saganii]|uniref:NETI motif-containing protein n=1 Tax=Peribacillus saganii TaxID=2303992 RepID=A0A372LMZ7_9BACI|nr:NETI motif-containing protein [Peribacillus saganii]RFU68898.1 NETI motif-containing protein [Peribacillus saganii]
MNKKTKQIFEVEEGETLVECLNRIREAGYYPVKRTEKPIFEEKIINGQKEYEPIDRKIIFEAKLIE